MKVMTTAHAYLGYTLVVLMIAYSVGNLVAWREARRLRGLEWLFVVIFLAMAAQSLQGVWLLLAGHRPSEWLHVVYSLAVLVALLGARGLAVAASGTHERLVIAAGSAIATVFLLRVLATG